MAARSELMLVLEQIERDKGIPKSDILHMIEGAVVSSLRKHVGKNAVIEAAIDPDTAQFTAYVVKKVSESAADPELEISLKEARFHKADAQIGEEIRLPAPAADFARIAAQTAKQLLAQKVRESERDKLYEEFKPKEGQIVTGSVHRFLDRSIIMDLGKVEGVMPMREQIRRERYGIGHSVRAVILRVDKSSVAPQILLSRAAPLFLERLLEIEIPEIKDKTVEILSVARDPGNRAKVLVKSNDPKIDPVGSCIGLRGSRIRAVMGELSGEKIDLIAHKDDPAALIAAALAPASTVSVAVLDKDHKRASALVAQAQIPIALGRDGQNLDLARRLTGWTIEVRTQTEPEAKAERESSADAPRIDGIGPKTAELLKKAGFHDARALSEASVETLSRLEGIGEKTATKIIAAAKASLENRSTEP